MSIPLAIGSDQLDYSKYDSTCSKIKVYGTVDLAHQAQDCVITLSRNDAYGIVASHTIHSIGASFTTTFDLNSVEMQDADSLNRVAQGDYTITATLADTTTKSIPITVSICSVNELRTRWLYGLTTLSSEIILPRIQPKLLPVRFVQVSPAYVKDFYDLVYVTSPTPSLSFAGGPAVPVTPFTGVQDLVLLDEREADWVQVRVDTFALPGTHVTETLVLDEAQLQDIDFIEIARLATGWVEDKLGFLIEPRLCISERLTKKFPNYERLYDGATFYDDFNNSTGVFPDISLPLQQLQVVKDLEGWYNQNQVLTVPKVWIQVGSRAQGNIELVPTSGQASALVWQSFPFAFASMQTRLVPGFWQFSVIAGLRDLTGRNSVIREAIAKKAGIDLALFAATAYKAGISAQSTSRDNISISTSYTASAMYSTFAHLTIPWSDWLDKNMPVIRRSIGGIPVVTMV